MQNETKFPMPNTRLSDGRLVIASCYYREMTEEDNKYREEDDDWPDTVVGVLLLDGQAPYYSVAYLSGNDLAILAESRYPNIIPAAEAYSDEMGCYE